MPLGASRRRPIRASLHLEPIRHANVAAEPGGLAPDGFENRGAYPVVPHGAGELERQPGFVSYALARTGAREVVAVTIFETEAQLRAAMERIAPSVRRHVRPLAAAGPERRRGEVLHYRAAITALERPAAASPRTR